MSTVTAIGVVESDTSRKTVSKREAVEEEIGRLRKGAGLGTNGGGEMPKARRTTQETNSQAKNDRVYAKCYEDQTGIS